MFDTWRETSLIYPVFPLLIHEKFKFTKDISNAKSLSDIQNALSMNIITQGRGGKNPLKL